MADTDKFSIRLNTPLKQAATDRAGQEHCSLSELIGIALVEKLERDQPGLVTDEMRQMPRAGAPRVAQPLNAEVAAAGDEIARLRRARGLNQISLAHTAGISGYKIQEAERGALALSDDDMARVMAVLSPKKSSNV